MRDKYWRHLLDQTVWIAALGYFVDLYDLVLFGIVRIPSLKALGVAESDILSVGTWLLNLQMGGLLVGGFAWGVLGDRLGRAKALYGSIFLYSVANILNGLVTSVPAYGALRFIAGFGLAGELGAAVTIVSETLPRDIRGLGSTIIGLAGFAGAILAASLGNLVSWQHSFFIGGGLGLLLLLARLRMGETALFKSARARERAGGAGPLRLLLVPKNLWLYLRCLAIGVPVWFVAGVLVYFSPELAKDLGVTGPVLAGQSILFNYAGGIVGDILGGLLSQRLKSRKKAILVFISATTVLALAFFVALAQRTPEAVYFFCFLLGVGLGYWTLFVAMSSEQFGTDVRATVATSLPNLARGAVIPMTIALAALKPSLGVTKSVLLIGVACFAAAIAALLSVPETFDRELDYLEAEASG